MRGCEAWGMPWSRVPGSQLKAAAFTRPGTPPTLDAKSFAEAWECDPEPWLTSRCELTTACTNREHSLSTPRLVAMCSVLGAALFLLVAPSVLASRVLDANSFHATNALFEQVSRLAAWAQLARLPVFLVLPMWVARSPQEE
jgi:hypothetical protein